MYLKSVAAFYCFAVVFCSCNETEQVQLALSGTVVGNVQTYGAKGELLDDHSNVEVYLDGNPMRPVAISDVRGDFIIEELTTGTYNFYFVKNEFDTSRLEGIRFLGGLAPIYIDTKLVRYHRAILIPGLQLETVKDNQIILNMDIQHEGNVNAISLSTVRLFLGIRPDVSFREYIYTKSVTKLVEPGIMSRVTSNVELPVVDSVGTWYLVAHGAHSQDFTYHRVSDGLKIFMGLGDPSDVLTISVP